MNYSEKTKAELLQVVQALEKKLQRLEKQEGARPSAKDDDSILAERNLLRTLIDNMPDFIYVKDTKSRFVLNNRAHIQRFGKKNQQEVAGKTDFDFFPKKVAKQLFDVEQEIMRTGTPRLGMLECLVHDEGGRLWVTSTKVPLRDRGGTVVGLVGISRDITEQKQREDAIAQDRHFLQMLLDNLPDHIYLKDRQSRMVRNNAAQLRFLGIGNQAEILGKTDLDIFPSEFARKAYEDEQRIMATGEAQIDKVWQVPDRAGAIHWISETKLPVRNDAGEIVGMVGISHDFSTRKHFEDDLMFERTLLHALLDNVPDSIYFKDAESRFIRVSRAWARHRRLEDPASVEGRSDFDFFPAGEAKERFEEERQIIKTGMPLIGKIEKSVPAEGTPYFSSVTKVPLRDAEGRIVGTVGISHDITKVIQAENSLAHERSLLRTLIDNIPDYIFIKDVQGRFLINNEAHIHLLQRRTQEELAGKSDFDFQPAHLAQRSQSEEQEIVRTGIPIVNREEPALDSIGIRHWLLVTKVPLYDTEHNIVGLVGISRDITKRKNFEEMLMFERQLLHTLLNNVPDSIYFKDARSRFIRVNTAWANRRRLADPEDVVGKTDFDFFPPVQAQQYFDDEQDILRTGRPLINKAEKIEVPGMAPRWISITKVPVTDAAHKIIGTCGISRDITQLKLVEEELAHERDLLHMFMDNSQDLIYFKDRQSRFIRINNAHAKRFRLDSPEDAVGKTDFDFFAKAHAQEAFDDEQRIIATGIPLIGKIERESETGEEEHWALTSKYPMKNRDGEIEGIFGISRDITAIKQYEEELHRAKDELEERVAERTRDLKRANEGQQERIAQLDFLTSTSYEMAQFIRLDELFPVILRSFGSRFGEYTASFCLVTDDRFSCVAAVGALESEAGRTASELAMGVFKRVPLQRPYMVENWLSDDYLSQFAWPDIGSCPVYMVIPLQAENRTLGAVQIFAAAGAAGRYAKEEQVLATLGAQAAISLSNALNYKELGETARLQGELEAARTIQRNFTPQRKPMIPHVNLKGVYYPAFEVGGDYLDYFQTVNGDWVVVIADVCGKGIPAALLMTVLRSSFRAEGRTETSARRLLVAVNDSMMINLDDRSFVTALCLIISKDGTGMSHSRAGHPKLIRVNGATGAVETIESGGVALGLVADAATFDTMLEEITIPLNPGDRFLTYTDGLSEALNPEHDCYGLDRLHELLAARPRDESPESMIQAIMKDIKVFTRGAPYHDDLTILSFKVEQ